MIQYVPKTRITRSIRDTRPVICHVIHAMGVGGAEVLVDQMVRRMAEEFRCVVAVLDDIGELGRRLHHDGIAVEHLQRSPGIDRRCARRLRRFADQQGAVLLHAHQCTPFFQAMLSRGFTGSRPVVFTEHGRHFPDYPSRKRMVVNRLLLQNEDRLIGCGGAVRTALIQNEGLPSSRVEVIYNGVDLAASAGSSADARQRIRAEFGYGEHDFVAVQVARLHELKDHQTALKTIDAVRREVPHVRLLLAGEGEQRQAIEDSVRRMGLQQHVTLAGTRSDVADLLAAADAFLMTSISEGIPLTVIEAMAAGKPVVSTAVGGIPEMIVHGQSGFLAASGDAKALAESLMALQKNPVLAAEMADLASREAEARFSLDAMLSSYRQVYQEVIAASGVLS